MTQVDVTIVGAGPAGATLGLLLAKKGVKVAILDHAKEFNNSPKGAMLHPSTLSILEYLNILEDVKRESEIITKAEFFWDNDLLLEIDYKELHSRIPYGLSINYYHLQKTLLKNSEVYNNHSMSYGCEIVKIEQVGSEKCISYKQGNDIKEIYTSIVVAADGKNSRIREYFNIEVDRWNFDHENLLFIINRPENWSSKLRVYRDESHYIVSVPISKDHLLLLYSIPKGSFETVKEQGIHHIRETIEKLNWALQPAIEDSSFDWPKFVISYQGLLAKTWVEDHVLLIGDSAHSMHSLGGQGMNFSLQDAVIAAKVISGSIQKSDFSRAALIEYENIRKPYVEDYVLKQKEFPILSLTNNNKKIQFKNMLYDSIPALKLVFEAHLSAKPEGVMRELGALQ